MLLVNLFNYIYICLKMTDIYKNHFLLSIEKMPGVYIYIYVCVCVFSPESSLLPTYLYPV